MTRLIMIAVVLLSLCINSFAQITVEVHTPKGIVVHVRRDKAETGITKYIVTHKGNAHITLTASVLDAGRNVLHTHTDWMGQRAEIAWAKEVRASRLLLVIKRTRYCRACK